MKIKTSELTGEALDYAVSIAKGHESKPLPYSTSWHLMGPIIEDELIMLDLGMDSRIALIKRHTDFMDRLEEFLADGPDYLEAAAKCYVMSVYGYTVDIPDAVFVSSLGIDAASHRYL